MISGVDQDKFSIKFTVHEGKFYKIRLKKSSLKISFYCRLLLLNRPLKNLAEDMLGGPSKMFFPHRYVSRHESLNNGGRGIVSDYVSNNYGEAELKLFNKAWDLHDCKRLMDYAKVYCEWDVRILMNVHRKFCLEFKSLVGFSPRANNMITMASLSFVRFVGRSLNSNEIVCLPNSFKVARFIRNAYYGGHTSVYKGFLNEGELCYYYDFPSIYGIAISEILPTGIPVYKIFYPCIGKGVVPFIEGLLGESVVGFFKISFIAPVGINIPLLPVKGSLSKESGSKLYFCVGEGVGTYYIAEILRAVELGYTILSLSEMVVFKGGYPFKTYLHNLFIKKEEAKAAGNFTQHIIFKSLITNLYGKFAMNISTKSVLRSTAEFNSLEGVVRSWGINDDYMITEEFRSGVHSGGFNVNVSVSAAVTSWGRVILNTGIINVLRSNEGSELIYTDTDSIFISSKSEIIACELWLDYMWSRQRVYSEVYFIAPKMYFLRDLKTNSATVKVKGVKVYEGNNID